MVKEMNLDDHRKVLEKIFDGIKYLTLNGYNNSL